MGHAASVLCSRDIRFGDEGMVCSGNSFGIAMGE